MKKNLKKIALKKSTIILLNNARQQAAKGGDGSFTCTITSLTLYCSIGYCSHACQPETLSE